MIGSISLNIEERMATHRNQYGQPIGSPTRFTPAPFPKSIFIQGEYCSLVPVQASQHAEYLFEIYTQEQDWTYLFYGPYKNYKDFYKYIEMMETNMDPYYLTILDKKTNKPLGTFSLLRIRPEFGVIEIGHIVFSPLLKRTIIATEAHFLLMKYVFDTLQYRRYEWKCDSLNTPSRKSAERLGFTFEGLFRKDIIYRERNRDTAWFSIIDTEWSSLKTSFENWLSKNNFSESGIQKRRLQDFRQA